jgi:hypothetical protein
LTAEGNETQKKVIVRVIKNNYARESLSKPYEFQSKFVLLMDVIGVTIVMVCVPHMIVKEGEESPSIILNLHALVALVLSQHMVTK